MSDIALQDAIIKKRISSRNRNKTTGDAMNECHICKSIVDLRLFDREYVCEECIRRATALLKRVEIESVAGRVTEIGDLEHTGRPGIVIDTTRAELMKGRNLAFNNVRVILEEPK